MMYKKLSKYVADKCDPKSFHPVSDVKDVERFKPLCIVEKKKHLGFWKKNSMNPTSIELPDMLVRKDLSIAVSKTEFALPTEEGEDTLIKLGASFANKIAQENELDYVSSDKMNLVFDLALEKYEVPYEELLAALQENPLDEVHPLYSYAKSPKNTLCLVTETLSTRGESSGDAELQVLTLLAEGESATHSTITADIFAKGSAETKSSAAYQISPGTVLAYKCVELKIESDGTVTLLQGIPLTGEECKDTPEHAAGQPNGSEAKEAEDETAAQEAETMDAEVGKGDGDSESVDEEITDEDLEVPIIIRDINQEEPINQIRNEIDPLLNLGYFTKLQSEIRTLIANASEKDFQLIYLLLYRANLYIANNTGEKFMTLAALDKLIGEEIKVWKSIMSRIGFSVPKDATDPNACVRFPKKDDRGTLQAFMGVIGSIININTDARKNLSSVSPENVKILHNVVEMQLQNVSTFVSDPAVEGMISKEPVTMDFLTACGFTKSSEDENMLTFTQDNLYMLFDVYALLSVLSAGKKPFLKNSPSFSKEKKRASLLPRMASFRRQKSSESQKEADAVTDDKTTNVETNEDKSDNVETKDDSTSNTNETDNTPTTEL